MSETKFTKGEWVVNGRLIWSSGCIVASCSSIDIGGWGEVEANAYLMATSPKLYKALEGTNNELHHAIIEINRLLAERVTCATEDEPDWWDQQTVYENEVLLAKARGEQ